MAAQQRPGFAGFHLFVTMLALAIATAPTFDEINADSYKTALLSCGLVLALILSSRQRRVFSWATKGASIDWKDPGNWILASGLLILLHAMFSSLFASLIPALKDAGRMVLFLGAFVLVRSNQQDIDPRWIFSRLSLAALVASLIGLGQFYFGWSFIPQGAEPASTFVNRNFAAEVLAICLWGPFFLAKTAGSVGASFRWGLVGGFILVFVVTTGSRSAMLACLCAGSVYAATEWLKCSRSPIECQQPRLRYAMSLIGAALVIVCLLPFASIAKDFEGMHFFDFAFEKTFGTFKALDPDASISVRKELLFAAMQMGVGSFPLGVGAGGYGTHLIAFQSSLGGYELEDFVHNEYLQWFAEYGLVGIAFSLALFCFLARALLRSLNTHEHDQVDVLAIAMLVTLLVVMFFGFPMHLACGPVLLGTVCGLLAPLRQPASVPTKIEHRSLAACSALSVLLVGSFLYSEWNLVTGQKVALEVQTYLSGMGDDMKPYREEASQFAVKSLPMSVWHHRVMANTADELASIGELDSALKLYLAYLSHRPMTAGTLVNIAKIHMLQGNEGLAQKALEDSLQLQPGNMPALTYTANAMAKEGNLSGAKAVFQDLLGSDATSETTANARYKVSDEYFHSSCRAFSELTKDTELFDKCLLHRAKYSDKGYTSHLELAERKRQSDLAAARIHYLKAVLKAPRALKKKLLSSAPEEFASWLRESVAR